MWTILIYRLRITSEKSYKMYGTYLKIITTKSFTTVILTVSNYGIFFMYNIVIF